MEFVLVAAFAIAGGVVAATWFLTGNPTLAVVAATIASVAVLAIGDARRRSERHH
jgi:membrane protein implicated in regulation of membrane protease activity